MMHVKGRAFLRESGGAKAFGGGGEAMSFSPRGERLMASGDGTYFIHKKRVYYSEEHVL